MHDKKKERKKQSCALSDLEQSGQYTRHGECRQHAAVPAALSGLLSVVLRCLAHFLPQQHCHSAALPHGSNPRPGDELGYMMNDECEVMNVESGEKGDRQWS